MSNVPIRDAATLILYRVVPDKMVFCCGAVNARHLCQMQWCSQVGVSTVRMPMTFGMTWLSNPRLSRSSCGPQLAHYIAAARETFEEAGVHWPSMMAKL